MTATLEVRYVRVPGGVIRFGAFAGTDTMHDHVPDKWTGSSCMACFGWPDDPRHLYRKLPAGRGAKKSQLNTRGRGQKGRRAVR